MDPEKKYFAFISYKREDEKWAVWLQHKLEHYKLPSNLNGRTDLPREIRPIFRDKSELASGVLADEIQSALEGSKYLIVICSPRAAQSQWVGKEVQSFIEMGRTDKIIPFIIGGMAHAQKPEDECFPLALLNLPPEQELLGINIDEMGRDAAAVKVVAQMFGLKFDTLWQRYEREQRRRRFFIIATALLLALAGVAVAIGFSRQNKKITEQNERITKQNEEIVKQSEDILKKNDRLVNDSVIMAAQMDSIKTKDAYIIEQQDSISQTNVQLNFERDNLKKANWKMIENQALAVSEKAMQLTANENSYLASILAIEVLPKDLAKPNRPYTVEAETALRGSLRDRSFILCGHEKSINSAFFSYDGKYVISASDDCTIKIWDVINGVCVKTLHAQSKIQKAIFSHDGSRIASLSDDDMITIWDFETGKNLLSFPNGGNTLAGNMLAYTSDDKMIITYCNKRTKFWDADNGSCLKVLDGYAITSYDGSLIATDGTIMKVWEIKDAKNIECISAIATYPVLSPSSFSLDNDLIVCEDDDPEDASGLCVVNWKNGKILRMGDNKDYGWRFFYHSIAYGKDEIATVSSDRTLRIWKYGRVSYEHQYDNNVSTVAYSPDGDAVVCSFGDNTIHVIDLNPDKTNLKQKIDEIDYYTMVAVNQKTNHIAFNYENDVYIYDVDLLKTDRVLSNIQSFVFSKDGNLFAYVTSDSIKVFDFHRNKLIQVLIDDKDEITSIAISPDNKWIASRYNSYHTLPILKIWEIETGKYRFSLTGYLGDISSKGNNILTISEDSTIKVWDLKSGECVSTLKEHSATVNAARFNQDGTMVVSCSDDNTVKLWDINTSKCIRTFGHYEAPLDENEYVDIIVMHPFEEKLVFGGANSVCFINNEKWIASAYNDGTVKFWDVNSGECLNILNDHLGPVYGLSLNKEGNRLITYSSHKEIESEVKVWDVETGKCIQSFPGDGEWINDAGWCSDQRSIYCISHGGSLLIWDFPPLQELIDETRERFKDRPLTPEERHQYYLE